MFTQFMIGVLGLSASLPAGRPAASVDWQASFPAAFARAAAEKKPVFIAINMDDEAANDELATSTYHAAKFVLTTARVICLVASKYRHEEVADPSDPGRLVCSRFGHVRCADHIAIDRAVRATFLTGQIEIAAPQHILARSDRTPIQIKEWAVSECELTRLIDQAVAVLADPVKARRLERERLVKLVDEAASRAASRSEQGVAGLVASLQGWATDVALEVLRSRAPAELRIRLARELGGGPQGEAGLVGLLEDRFARVREAAVEELGHSKSATARDRLTKRLELEPDERVRLALGRVLGSARG